MLEEDPNIYYFVARSASDLWELLGSVDSNHRITFFEIIAHCTTDKGHEGWVRIGDDYLIGGTAENASTGYESGVNIALSSDLIQRAFSPTATLEFEGCYTAQGDRGTARAFATILPGAEVWGYTGYCYDWPGRWETFPGLLSEWVWVCP